MNHKKLKNEYYKELYEKSTGKEIFLWIPFIKELFIKILELKDKKNWHIFIIRIIKKTMKL